MKCDVVIIGSGIAGLTAAAILARQGRQVIVIEKQPRPGGALKRFKRDKIAFDVGFHYTGSLGEGEILRFLWEYCGVIPELDIIPFPVSGHDALRIHGYDRTVRTYFSYKQLAGELKKHFPSQSSAIDAYLSRIQDICSTIPFYNPDLPLTPFLQGYKSRPQSLAVYLQNLTGDPVLQAILASPAFLYGVPAQKASLEVHATVAHAFYSGAYAINGGGQAIVDAFLAVLKKYDVEILTGYTVNTICVDHERVVSVVTSSEDSIDCTDVIFTGHPADVLDMVPASVFRPAYRTRVTELHNTISMFAVFGTVSGSSSREYLKWTNHCLIPSGLELIPETATTPSDQHALLLTSPGCRDKNMLQQNRNGVILLRPALWEEVKPFQNSSKNNRPEAYAMYKEKIACEMLHVARKTWDGCGEIHPLAVGTPLTFRDELTAPQGSTYGAMHCLEQFNPGARTRLRGLWLSGQSTLMAGVVGASLSGMVTAGEITGLETLWENVRRCR